MNAKQENLFIREYFDPYKNKNRNSLVHDPKTTEQHRRIVSEIFEWAIRNKRTVYTKAYLKGGEIADIVIPSLTKPIIEVRNSELKIKKDYDTRYEHLRQFVDVDDPFKLT